MNFETHIFADAVECRVGVERQNWLKRLISRQRPEQETLGQHDRRVTLALADLRALSDQLGEPLDIDANRIRMSHRLASALDADTAQALGLPRLTDYVLETDVQGVLGRGDFRLATRWLKNGQPRAVRRVGAFLGPKGHEKRIPLWMLDALAVSETQQPCADDARHWEALARFRKALEPGVEMRGSDHMARISMSDFLQRLQVSLADQFSISPDAGGDNFEVVPFYSGRDREHGEATEADAEVDGRALSEFQQKLRSRGALHSFKLGDNRYLVIDPAAAPALRVMSDMQRAPINDRREFIRNPRQRIAAAIETELSAKTEFLSLDPATKEEMLDALATPLFVETEEYAAFSERVIGIEEYKGNPFSEFIPSGLIWYTETFPEGLKTAIADMDVDALSRLVGAVQRAMAQGQEEVPVGEFQLPATESTLELLRLTQDRKARVDGAEEKIEEEAARGAPVVLQTKENLEKLEWQAKLAPRTSQLSSAVPCQLRTALKDHQVKSLEWQIEAWRAGLPGVLNADEQGLGKTLQTISFLVWLNEAMKEGVPKRPILVVAPTSLLRNWEEEVERHVAQPGLGYLVRLYGGTTSARKLRGHGSRDTERGECTIDLSDITRSVQQGNGHLTWVLTTYTTLTNYQHSLARIPFAAIVFDEIQNIKNPGTLAATACKAMKADFRIGLTGTPIENSTDELWAIMDQLAPGALSTLKEFRSAYKEPQAGNMAELYQRVFGSQNGLAPLAIRRLKSEVARDLPEKARLLHPRLMPPVQARRYDEARIKLAQGGMGAALKMLHHIRGVSVHPAVNDPAGDHEYISASARLSAVFDILRRVKRQGERALVFIEHRKMQYRFIELAKAELDLQAIDLINGETPIPRRQQIVNRFQSAQPGDGRFDILVLGPKAAGTGLTLTAATHVIHLSRWWNPAVEEQCNDRVHRIGQTRPVTVHIPLAVHPELREMSFDLLLQTLMQRKRRLASAALWPMGEAGNEAAYLQEQLQHGSQASGGDPIESAMKALFERDKTAPLARHSDGSWLIN